MPNTFNPRIADSAGRAFAKSFLALAGSAILLGARDSRAESGDIEEARTELDDILLQPAYQPRTSSKSWIEQLWESHGESFVERIKESLRWMHDRLPDVDQPEWLKALGRFVENAFGSLKALILYLSDAHWILPAIFLVALAALAYRYRSYISALFPARTRTRAVSATDDDDEYTVDVDQAFQAGNFTKLLEAIRLMLRRGYSSKYNIKRSISDRELVRRIARNDTDAEVFKEAAAMFESSAFAGQTLDDARARELYSRYSSTRSRSER